MTAKEYAKRFYELVEDEGTNKAIYITFCGVFREANTLKEQRNAQSNAAFASILNELEDKWRAICRLVPELRPSGFIDFIRDEMPELWVTWNHINYTQKQHRNIH